MHRILICDDERDIVSALKIYLEAEGYDCLCSYGGEEALQLLDENDVQLVLLDIMMPGMDGIEVINRIRASSNVPVIFLSAKAEDTDKILGLNLGADDYVTKPFNPVELMARVRSQLRRYTMLGASMPKENELRAGGILMDDREKTVFLDGEPVKLTPTEYDILHLLLKNPGKVFRPDDIYRRVRNEEPYGAESSIAVHIRHLREKLEINPAEPRYIKAVWGQGYKLERGKE
ncbi:MAG: response regulator transcription factor [Oscillospiraceae bacterium]|nr:response regulator transcription factor [Oscillospiraceae bacterium]